MTIEFLSDAYKNVSWDNDKQIPRSYIERGKRHQLTIPDLTQVTELHKIVFSVKRTEFINGADSETTDLKVTNSTFKTISSSINLLCCMEKTSSMMNRIGTSHFPTTIFAVPLFVSPLYITIQLLLYWLLLIFTFNCGSCFCYPVASTKQMPLTAADVFAARTSPRATRMSFVLEFLSQRSKLHSLGTPDLTISIVSISYRKLEIIKYQPDYWTFTQHASFIWPVAEIISWKSIAMRSIRLLILPKSLFSMIATLEHWYGHS